MKIFSAILKYFLLFFRKGVIEEDIEEIKPLSETDIKTLKQGYRICNIVGIPPDCIFMEDEYVWFNLKELHLDDQELIETFVKIENIIGKNLEGYPHKKGK